MDGVYRAHLRKHQRAAAEAATGHACTEHPALAKSVIDHVIEFGTADLVVVA